MTLLLFCLPGQYAYAGYMPNRPSFVAKPIPARGSDEEKVSIGAPGPLVAFCAQGNTLGKHKVAQHWRPGLNVSLAMHIVQRGRNKVYKLLPQTAMQAAQSALTWGCHVQALLGDFDYEYLRTLSDPVRTLETMLLTKLLSTHAQDEFYLSGPQTDWISVRRPRPPICPVAALQTVTMQPAWRSSTIACAD